MLTVSFDGNPCHLAPGNFFKLSYGVRPSFGCFTMNISDAEAAVTAGTPATLRLHNTYLYNIYPIKSETGDALDPAIGRIYFADERVLWPFFYGAQDYNTYTSSGTPRDLGGGETDYALDNLNSASEWTFTEIFEDIFENIFGLTSANYTLHLQALNGAAPTRMPRNIRGNNIPAPEILHQLLAQANCFLAVDLLTDPPHYQVIPIGDENTWASAVIYRIGEVSTLAGVHYRSLQNGNENHNPGSGAPWWAVLVAHERHEMLISAKVSRSAAAKMLASSPFRDDSGLYALAGNASGIGGTSDHYVPSPYEAFYEGAVVKNSSFLGDMGDELTAEYKLSFQNSWYNIRYSGAQALSLGRGAQEITWELSDQRGFTTQIRSFRPREEAFPIKHTLFAHDRYWIEAGSQVHRAFVKSTPGATTSVDVYLGVDATGTEVTVECYIYGGGNLNGAYPTLVDGMPLYVQYDTVTSAWKNVTPLFKIGVNCGA